MVFTHAIFGFFALKISWFESPYWGTFWGQFWVELIGGTISAFIFLFLVLYLLKPKIRIAPFLCRVLNSGNNHYCE